MDIKEYVKATGSFLKAEDIKQNPNMPFTILHEGEFVKSEKFGNERLHISGEFNGTERTFDCSKTNAREITKKLSEDMKKWIGRQVFFETYKTKTSDGKMVDALNIINVK